MFFELGKRLAARAQQLRQSPPTWDRAEQNLGLELAKLERSLSMQKIEVEANEDIIDMMPATALVYKKPKGPVKELTIDLHSRGTVGEIGVGQMSEFGGVEEGRNRILSLRSIYELG